MRIDRHEMMMQMAEVVALRGTCSRLQVGAVIARDGRPISSGYNGNVAGIEHCYHPHIKLDPEWHIYLTEEGKANLKDEPGCKDAMHAEANAIAFAARYGVGTEDAYIYTTHQPCYDCARLIINAGIGTVFYRNPYRKLDGLKLLEQAGIEVYSLIDGVLL